MTDRFDLHIITLHHSEAYCGYFRRLVFGNSWTFSHIPPCFHAKTPNFPCLFDPRDIMKSSTYTCREPSIPLPRHFTMLFILMLNNVTLANDYNEIDLHIISNVFMCFDWQHIRKSSTYTNEMMVFQASFVHIAQAKLGQADAGDNEAKLMTKLAPEWVRTSDPVIRSPARYRWTTAPAVIHIYMLGTIYSIAQTFHHAIYFNAIYCDIGERL